MFSLCVLTTVSLAGLVWYKSFQKDMYALLNPEEVTDQRFLAQDNSKSLFSSVSEVGKDLKATLYNILNLNKNSKVEVKKQQSGKVYLLPLSEKK